MEKDLSLEDSLSELQRLSYDYIWLMGLSLARRKEFSFDISCSLYECVEEEHFSLSGKGFPERISKEYQNFMDLSVKIFRR